MLLLDQRTMKGCWLTVLLAVIASSSVFIPCTHAKIPDSQTKALLNIFKALNLGFYQEFTAGPDAWTDGTDSCLWRNVTCDATGTTVRALLLNQLQFGVLPAPADFAALPNLTTIDFSQSTLSGNLSSVGAALASLSGLRFLALWGNRLEGPLPPEIGALAGLQSLQLGNNLLTGPIPEEWGGLQSLEELWLGNNQLSGTLPSWFRKPLPSLNKIILSMNKLEGVLDLAVNQFDPTSLFVNVQSNYFNGTGTRWGQPEFYPLLDNDEVNAPLASNCFFDANFTTPQRNKSDCTAFYLARYPPSPPPSPPPPPPPPPVPALVVPKGGGSSAGLIAGAAAGGSAALVVLAVVLWCFCFAKRKDEDDVFWKNLPPPGSTTSAGAMVFSFRDVEKMTGQFAYQVGRGGFGPVYYGVLKDGRQVAVKRRDKASKQGADEFTVEVEVLSNLARHRHLVNLVGFCCEKAEQILVYEFMPNGTLLDHLKGGPAAASAASAAATAAATTTATTGTTASASPPPSEVTSLVAASTHTSLDSGQSTGPSASSGEGKQSFWKRSQTADSASQATHARRGSSRGTSRQDPDSVPLSVPLSETPTTQSDLESGRGVGGGAKLTAPPPVAPIVLTWRMRLRCALGAARGINYLHSEIPGNTTLIHRDLKPSNILLDERLEARVADFGLAKLGQKVHDSLGDARTAAFSTNVKGTPGFVDPEYYQLQQLTSKSDVYSFGVILLMLVTGRSVVDHGKLRAGADDWSLQEWALPLIAEKRCMEIVDPAVDKEGIVPESLQAVCDLAQACVQPRGRQRPAMAEVVHTLEGAFTAQKALDKSLGDELDDEEEAVEGTLPYPGQGWQQKLGEEGESTTTTGWDTLSLPEAK